MIVKTEAGMGGRLGRSNMTHWDLGHVVKSQARKARRVNDTWAAYESLGVFTFDSPIVTFEPAPAETEDLMLGTWESFIDRDEDFECIDSWLDAMHDMEPECSSYANLLDDLMTNGEVADMLDAVDEVEELAWSEAGWGTTLELRNGEDFIANQGFIVTHGKWYC